MRDASTQIYVYDPVQRAFHWVMAAIILAVICVGIYAADLPKGDPSRGYWFGLHKSLGVTVFALAVLRLGWRVAIGAPPYGVPLDRLTHLAASAAHAALYVLMIGLPIGGYVMSTAGDHPVSWFGLFTLPRLVPVDKPLAKLADAAHVNGAWIMIGVLVVHILAAIWHYRIKRDEVMARMAPGLAAKKSEV